MSEDVPHLGPNVRRLIAHKMALLIVPPGTKSSLATVTNAVKFGNVGKVAREATSWVESALAAVKSAPDNPYGDDDEAIAGAILDKVRELKESRP